MTRNIIELQIKIRNNFACLPNLSKAFDSASQNNLLNTLSNIGFRGVPLTVSMKQTAYQKMSNMQFCKAPCWPILFKILIKDLFKCSCKGKVLSFADIIAIL